MKWRRTELKFQISPKDLRRLKAARALRRSDGKPAKEENLVSVYFDTGKHKLRRKGLSLRVRYCGHKRFQTIKTEGDIPFSRGEWERKIHSDAPDFRAARGTALEPFLTKRLKRQLKPIFETRVHRLTVPIRENSSRIELALDEGQVRAGQKSAAVGEVELELKRGKRDDLFKLARVIGELVPAKLALQSKSEQGYDLAADTPVRPVQGSKIKLQSGTTIADAFHIIGGSVLRHLATNEAAVRTSNPEGVHQMRIGLRRLRAAISVFSELLDDRQTERIKVELKWLTGELGSARDLDVYIKTKIKPLRGAAPAKRGLREFAGELAGRRTVAFQNAKDAVDSPRYRSLMLNTLQWIEAGDWAKRARARGDRRVKRFAADILTRRTKKAMKKGDNLQELDARQRHKLRIAIKKLTYSSEFFESLFAGRKVKKRLSGFKNPLKELQDSLGALNDIAVHQKLATKFATGYAPGKRRARSFAAGVVSGREQSEIEPLLKAAAKATRKFEHARPFWT